jgi:hypothetical protein
MGWTIGVLELDSRRGLGIFLSWCRAGECLLLFVPKSFVFLTHIKNLKIKIYKTVILPVVLYGCEAWFLTLGEEHRLRVFKNRVLRKIFGPKREEDGKWRILHNNELHSLYFSTNIVRVIKSRKMRVGWTCGTHEGGERCLKGFGWEARRQETTGRT